MKILIVDDEDHNVVLLQYALKMSGYSNLRATTDPHEFMRLFEEFQPDIVLLDLMMPNIDGFEIMRELGTRLPPGDCLPILVLTADVSLETKRRALDVGATDFLTKPFDHVEVLLRIRNLLHIRAQHDQLTRQNDTLEERVALRTRELSAAMERLEQTVSQLRDTQQQVIQHERMSALGTMAAGLAHDFNNSLSLIMGYSELLQGDLQGTPYEEHSDDFLGTIITAAQDAAKMFNRLREFYRPPEGGVNQQPTALNVVVEAAVALTRPRWHGAALSQGVTVKMRCELAPDLPPLLADAAELREMLTNLIFNAVDALPPGNGTITIQTSREENALPSPGGSALILEVSDTGIGMSEETRQRCLEPFFTTKGARGTGLGLAMVYGAVQRHGGSIALHSAPGEGTRFVLRLPLREWEPATPPFFIEALALVEHRILVVDDQEPYLKVLHGYLSRDDHAVETATDGYKALEKFRAAQARGEAFDLLITNGAMPDMSGEQLAAEIKALEPHTAVILLNGMGGLEENSPDDYSAVDLTLFKPITHAVLREAVGRVMAEPLTLAERAA